MSILSRLLLVATLLFAAAQAPAVPLRVQASGSFDASAPVSFLSAPGQTWSVSFVVDSDPVPAPSPLTEIDFFTTLPFSQFEYRLGGVAIATPALWIAFYNAGNGGGIDVFFSDVSDPLLPAVDALSFYTQQVYSGPETDPTVLPGVYPTSRPNGDGFIVTLQSVAFDQGETRVVISAVPLPGTLALVLLAALPLVASRGRSGRCPR